MHPVHPMKRNRLWKHNLETPELSGRGQTWAWQAGLKGDAGPKKETRRGPFTTHGSD
jgi:hypothetical protein